MDLQIAMLLGQDGMTSGAIYALLALSIVLVFTVTRIMLVPQGEFVTFGAMTMAALQAGQTARLAWLLLALAALHWALRGWRAWRRGDAVARALFAGPALLLPAVTGGLWLISRLPGSADWPMGLQALYTLALVVPLGPLLYDLCFRPIAAAHSLVLLIVSIAVHVVLVGLALMMFGAEGARTQPFSEEGLALGPVTLNGQTLWVLVVSLLLIGALYLFFERSLYGKALRATAVNRLGAELMGISPTLAGQACFGVAAFMGGLSGVLIAPLTTLYYDSGFIISLKGFVGAVVGGLISYPVGALGALGVGLVEAYSTFWASTYKEVIVFTLILPFLLWRSLATHHHEEDA
ncbi:branched-chain amino acid ABC transporter permease [Curvibacter sp. HBC61]|uniref:Branched-chain amino acid ABC transporter permease n=1 Tax=Curvibacter cyanobacteriorum TaxID=3026422 RepID=A0ABT5N532_9BURK|nr:branched-chain amino acid ABC transporter permease [Curvibacter sp. HBC61]MDD0840669.1 branched-chain amino acid ABC transporter permease [Curvibacter sp. HBC61]